MQKKNKSTFISYSSMDDINEVIHLKNYLESRKVDVFCDLERKQNNHAPIIDVLRERVKENDNLILLFTIESAKHLVSYGKSNKISHNVADTNYTYEELKTAMENHKNVIPVCIDICHNDDEIKMLMRDLFCHCFSQNDSYSYIYKKTYHQINDFYLEILNRLTSASIVKHPDFSDVYWVGTRESDMPKLNSNYGFKGSISLFGHKNEDNKIVMCDCNCEKRVDHNDSTDLQQDDFIKESVHRVIKNDPNAKFMFYNPYAVYKLKLLEKFEKKHFLCLNNEDILKKVNNKRSFRDLIKDIVPLVPILEKGRSDCDYDDLVEAKNRGEFEDNNKYTHPVPPIEYDDDLKFIVQAPVSSGGDGTFVLTKDNAQAVLSALDKKANYMVSVYYTKSIPVNIHAVIYSNKIIYSPGSIQLMREVSTENKLLYKGADFIAYHQISNDLREKFELQAKLVAQKLQEIGYRGVCGIDAIIHDKRVNIMEVNGRFQASTELINRAMLQSGLKTIQEMNFEAFYDNQSSNIEELTVNHNVAFSNYTYSYEGQYIHDKHIYNIASQSNQIIDMQPDGFNIEKDNRYIAQAYLYRLVFRNNIASINEDGVVLINENISTPSKWLVKQIKSKDKLTIKIALMILGIRVENKIRFSLREATNNAVDLQFDQGKDIMIINSPTNIRYVEFSPFSLDESKVYPNKYCVNYYGELLIDNVGVFPTDKNQKLLLSDGKHTYSEIAYLSTDRLRLHITNACCFKLQNNDKDPNGNGCKFCNIEVNKNPVAICPKDIKEVVDQYVQDKYLSIENKDLHSSPPVLLNHFLLGGQSRSNSDDILIETAKILQKYHMPIYAMTLPLSEETVRELIKYGVLEFSYNIEIFNERCREKYMPGKGLISVDKYINALKTTRQILNGVNKPENSKVVRSMVIVGLEPYKDMIEGIKKLVSNNIEPMLSVFRPLPDTPLENLNAPSIRSIYNLFFDVSNILFEASDSCGNNFRKLGPECSCCQNNTVSLPWNWQISSAMRRVWAIKNNYDKFKE